MASATTDRRQGLTGDKGFKAPVQAATTANITLSGEQTVGGVAVYAVGANGYADRVLVWNQTNPVDNGIWDVSTAAWTRSQDANGSQDLVTGTMGLIVGGAYADQLWILTTAGAIAPGSTALTFQVGIPSLPILAASSGLSLIGFIQALAGAQPTNGQTKARERVSVADFLSDANKANPTAAQATTAFQAAVNSGAKKVFVSANYTINAPITLAANQIIDFDGGSIIIAAGTVAANGVMYSNAKANVKIIDPIIDASATAGIAGINFVDSPSGTVIDGMLTECNLAFTASNNAVRMGYKARGTIVNMNGWTSTACYVSGANNVSLLALELYGGLEGVGIYNNAINVKHSQIESYNHTQDGFVIIAGQRINYVGCISNNNGQSGFTTQRQTAGTNVQRVTYNGCQAYSNTADGFDLRGANSVAWGVDMMLTATGCISTGNSGTGFYVVLAEGTQLIGCQSYNNAQQSFFINTSERVQLTGCRSGSGGSSVAAGTSDAGFLIYNCNYVTLDGCQSSNSNGATQSYGVSFTGTSAYGQVIGGYYENNTVAPYYLQSNRLVGSQANTIANISLNSVTYYGLTDEDGLGVPAHVRPKGSVFRRQDPGGNAEIYYSNGAGSWTLH